MIRPPEYKANSHLGTIFFETDFLMCPYMAFCKMSYVVLLKLTYNMFAAVKWTVFRLIMMKKSYKITIKSNFIPSIV